MRNYTFKIVISFFFLFYGALAFAQPIERLIKVVVTPNHQNWIYLPGEPATFQVQVMKNSELIKNAKIRFEFGPEQMTPTKRDSATLKDGQYKIEAGTMKEAGFLRCKVFTTIDGVRYENLATAAYAPDKIKPTTELPADFEKFWENAKTEAAKVPMDVKLLLLPLTNCALN